VGAGAEPPLDPLIEVLKEMYPPHGDVPDVPASSLSDLTANSLILLSWYYFLEAKLLSLFKGLKISMMPSPTGC
jgi:hypothetical protein